MTITYATLRGSPSGAIVRKEITRPDLLPNEVLVRMLYSGVCGTDAHYKYMDIALGHEGIGIVQEVGSEVKDLAVNTTVGIGYVRSSCLSCPPCLTGYHFFCATSPNNYGTPPSTTSTSTSSTNHTSAAAEEAYITNTGTFSTHIILPSPTPRLIPIPTSLPASLAGPLMCAGQTVWLPFTRGDIRPWETVGVVGLGGLGHLAVQFASKMGCRTVVFSGSEGKREEALGLGAGQFYTTSQLKEGKGLQEEGERGFVDHLLVTTSQLPNWKVFMPVMRAGGTVYLLTLSEKDDLKGLSAFALVTGEIGVRGYCASTVGQVREMLEFAGRHGVRPVVEEFEMSVEGVEAALARLERGEMRYRGVLKAEGV